jgi:plasmid stabilization system protein ParE
MSRFTVVWTREAKDQLADIWTNATDRADVTAAAAAIDAGLLLDVADRGAPLSEGLRKLVVPPLVALFSVSEPDRLVEIAIVFRTALPNNRSATPGSEGA